MVLNIVFPTTAICWLVFAILMGSVRGRHRTTLVGVMLAAGLHTGSTMFKWAWGSLEHTPVMPTWAELSREAQLNIVTAGIIGLLVIFGFSLFESKKE